MVTLTFNCGQCGEETTTYRSPSAMKLYPPKFCSLQCTGVAQRGARNPSYTGGRYIDPNGYVHVLLPAHPQADCRGYVYEHRVVAEKRLGRFLSPEEVVHHINHIKSDNDPDNMEVCESQAAHMNGHHRSEGGRRWTA